MSKITICVANQKGGTAKTTSTISLATGFADLLGKSVIVIDTDPQGDCAKFLGHDPAPGLHDWLIKERRFDEVSVKISENLQVIPSDKSTAIINTLLEIQPDFYNPREILTRAVDTLTADIILIDTQPVISALQLAALFASDWVLISATPEYAAECGVSSLTNTLEAIHKAGHDIKLLGILPTKVRINTKDHRGSVSEMNAAFPGLVLPTVRDRIAYAEAARNGKPIWEHNVDVSEDYNDVLFSVKKRLGI